jgi:aromatic ring-opening dioxygenase catalytic subunit (LigB family)
MSTVSVPKSQPEWRKSLEDLPETPQNIPAFFFAHGSPMLVYHDPKAELEPKVSLGAFLRDFGPALLKKYQPKGIVVFSAHWETAGERLGEPHYLRLREVTIIRSVVTDYGEENPLLMDYYGFPPELYQLEFKSRGDSALANRVVELYKEVRWSAYLHSDHSTACFQGWPRCPDNFSIGGSRI